MSILLNFVLVFDSQMNQEDVDNSNICAETEVQRKNYKSSPKLLNENFFKSYHLVKCLSSFLDV